MGAASKFTDGLPRRALARTISACLPWPDLIGPLPGYSIMLGVPWDLRHLLPVNLRFIARNDLSNLIDLHIVFDRRHRPEMDEIMQQMRVRFPDLPLRFHFYSPAAGWLAEKAHISTFYNSTNCVTALGACRTRWMILHDFDLYPLRADYFRTLHEQIRSYGIKFLGVERTRFDGLTDDDNVFGTWALAMDAHWLRNERKAHEVFHRAAKVGKRRVSLDPFSWLQLHTERSAVSAFGPEAWCHVKNLCSTYLRLIAGKQPPVAWRLHYLWYLESLEKGEDRLQTVIEAMRNAKGPRLTVFGNTADFSDVHITCANVLDKELAGMDQAIYGEGRNVTQKYCAGFRQFLDTIQ